MALVVGTNSWITLADAEIYFADRINNTPWTGLASDAIKSQYLVTAFNWIKFDPMFVVPYSADNVYVKNGQCEAALFLINYGLEYDRRAGMISSGVKAFEYSKWRETLGEVTKPYAVINYFATGGYYNGGVSMVLLVDTSTVT